MDINSDINVLGSIPDFNLVKEVYLKGNPKIFLPNCNIVKEIKTQKSSKRFEKAINNTFLRFKSSNVRILFESVLLKETDDSLFLFFLLLNSALNNDLFKYLNSNVFFPALYSGRVIIKKEDACYCLLDLKTKNSDLKGWSDSTLQTTASKYLTLLKKFNLLEGGVSKTIKTPYLNDKFFILFIYF